MTIWERPSVDVDVIELMAEIVDIWRSIGAATAVAMFSALAPGSVALTAIVGKSTAGRADTARSRYANTPKTINVAVINDVSTGRRMHNSDGFICRPRKVVARIGSNP